MGAVTYKRSILFSDVIYIVLPLWEHSVRQGYRHRRPRRCRLRFGTIFLVYHQENDEK